MTNWKPFLHVLTDEQKRLLPLLAPVSKKHFVLYGDTALALHLGHRPSGDFAFYSNLSVTAAEIQALLPDITFKDTADSCSATNMYSTETTSGVRIAFFTSVQSGRVGRPAVLPECGIQVASLEDLLPAKLAAILQRVSYQDYADTAAMIAHGVSLDAGLAALDAMYPNNMPLAHILRTLSCFEDDVLAQLSEQDREILVNAARQIRLLPAAGMLSQDLYEEYAPEMNQ